MRSAIGLSSFHSLGAPMTVPADRYLRPDEWFLIRCESIEVNHHLCSILSLNPSYNILLPGDSSYRPQNNWRQGDFHSLLVG
jgi:hypothetical protein